MNVEYTRGYLTALKDIAATHLCGPTLHSWIEEKVEEIAAEVDRNNPGPVVPRRWENYNGR